MVLFLNYFYFFEWNKKIDYFFPLWIIESQNISQIVEGCLQYLVFPSNPHQLSNDQDWHHLTSVIKQELVFSVQNKNEKTSVQTLTNIHLSFSRKHFSPFFKMILMLVTNESHLTDCTSNKEENKIQIHFENLPNIVQKLEVEILLYVIIRKKIIIIIYLIQSKNWQLKFLHQYFIWDWCKCLQLSKLQKCFIDFS